MEEYEGPGKYLTEAAKDQAAFVELWKRMSAQQRYEALTRPPVQSMPTESKPVQEPFIPPPAVESPPSFFWPPLGEPQPQSERPSVTNNAYDNRVVHVTNYFPVAGYNKQDLRIEAPYLR